MENEHFVGEIAQKAIIVDGEKILIQRDAGDVDVWDLPGGRLHKNEVPKEGIRREIFEELGVEAEVGDMFYSEQFLHTRSQKYHLLLAYRATLKQPASAFKLDPQEAAEIRWIIKAELYNQKIFENCLHALEAHFGVR